MTEVKMAQEIAKKTEEVKKAEQKLKSNLNRLEHASKMDHLVKTNTYETKNAAKELAKKQKELSKLK